MGIANDVIGVYYSYYSVALCMAITTLAILLIKRSVEIAKGKQQLPQP